MHSLLDFSELQLHPSLYQCHSKDIISTWMDALTYHMSLLFHLYKDQDVKGGFISGNVPDYFLTGRSRFLWGILQSRFGSKTIFFAWPGLIKPKGPIRDNEYHNSGDQLPLLNKSPSSRSMHVPIKRSVWCVILLFFHTKWTYCISPSLKRNRPL